MISSTCSAKIASNDREDHRSSFILQRGKFEYGSGEITLCDTVGSCNFAIGMAACCNAVLARSQQRYPEKGAALPAGPSRRRSRASVQALQGYHQGCRARIRSPCLYEIGRVEGNFPWFHTRELKGRYGNEKDPNGIHRIGNYRRTFFHGRSHNPSVRANDH